MQLLKPGGYGRTVSWVRSNGLTYVDMEYPDTNFCGSPASAWADWTESYPEYDEETRLLIHFPSILMPDAEATPAVVRTGPALLLLPRSVVRVLYIEDEEDGHPPPEHASSIDLYLLQGAWDPETVTWNSQPTILSKNWVASHLVLATSAWAASEGQQLVSIYSRFFFPVDMTIDEILDVTGFAILVKLGFDLLAAGLGLIVEGDFRAPVFDLIIDARLSA